MTTESTPWKAEADILSVTRPTAALIDRMQSAVANLLLHSPDPGCRFFTETRVTEASAGPALVVSAIAEYEGGERQSAVVVSGVVDHDRAEDRQVVIRTHLEQQHTRHDGPTLVFEEHHDAIRAALVDAIREFDPGAVHRQWPVEPKASVTTSAASAAEAAEGPRVERARVRSRADEPSATTPARSGSTVDPRQILGIALLLSGVAVLLWTIASGSAPRVAVGVVAAVVLGVVGNLVAGA